MNNPSSNYQSRSQSRSKQNNFQKLLDSYSDNIKTMIGVTRSDLRNIKRMEKY